MEQMTLLSLFLIIKFQICKGSSQTHASRGCAYITVSWSRGLPHITRSRGLPHIKSVYDAAPPPAFIRARDTTGCRCRGGSSSFARPRPPRLTPPTSTAGLVGTSLPAAFLACSADATQFVDGGCECCASFAPGAAAALLLGPAR